MKCKNCGFEFGASFNNCPMCGSKIEQTEAKTTVSEGEINWNTNDFPKPREMEDIKMMWPDFNTHSFTTALTEEEVQAVAEKTEEKAEEKAEEIVEEAAAEAPQPEAPAAPEAVIETGLEELPAVIAADEAPQEATQIWREKDFTMPDVMDIEPESLVVPAPESDEDDEDELTLSDIFGGTKDTSGQFYTFESKNDEFQKLLDQEYDRIRAMHGDDYDPLRTTATLPPFVPEETVQAKEPSEFEKMLLGDHTEVSDETPAQKFFSQAAVRTEPAEEAEAGLEDDFEIPTGDPSTFNIEKIEKTIRELEAEEAIAEAHRSERKKRLDAMAAAREAYFKSLDAMEAEKGSFFRRKQSRPAPAPRTEVPAANTSVPAEEPTREIPVGSILKALEEKPVAGAAAVAAGAAAVGGAVKAAADPSRTRMFTTKISADAEEIAKRYENAQTVRVSADEIAAKYEWDDALKKGEDAPAEAEDIKAEAPAENAEAAGPVGETAEPAAEESVAAAENPVPEEEPVKELTEEDVQKLEESKNPFDRLMAHFIRPRKENKKPAEEEAPAEEASEEPAVEASVEEAAEEPVSETEDAAEAEPEAQEASAEKTAEEPAVDAPAEEEAPAEENTAEPAVEEMPEEETEVQNTPAEEESAGSELDAEDAPAEEVPAEEAPESEETAAEAEPTEITPETEDVPAEAEPEIVEEAPAEETPAEDAPAEEPAPDEFMAPTTEEPAFEQVKIDLGPEPEAETPAPVTAAESSPKFPGEAVAAAASLAGFIGLTKLAKDKDEAPEEPDVAAEPAESEAPFAEPVPEVSAPEADEEIPSDTSSLAFLYDDEEFEQTVKAAEQAKAEEKAEEKAAELDAVYNDDDEPKSKHTVLKIIAGILIVCALFEALVFVMSKAAPEAAFTQNIVQIEQAMTDALGAFFTKIFNAIGSIFKGKS